MITILEDAEYSKEEEIADTSMKRPHLVILGSGVSRQVLGGKSPVMDDLIKIVGLESLLEHANIEYKDRNFEEIYSILSKSGDESVIQELHERIYSYFSSLKLPRNPTIYDLLILSLREKDIIATFNWDSLLLQALRRNQIELKTPKLAFLHGNVMIGVCQKDKVKGVNGELCPKCKTRFSPVTLLYPIKEKNYENDIFIRDEWKLLRFGMENAFMITIFGYGAPKSDIAAMEIFRKSRGPPEKNKLGQTEIIDIKDENELETTWEDFIYSHHYEIHKNFEESRIFNHPRRTGEAYIAQELNGKFVEGNPIPNVNNFNELWKWFLKFKQFEV